jgi:hypothetical protein
VAHLSREKEEGLPKVREFWWDLSLGRDRGRGLQLPKLSAALAARGIRHTIPERRDQREHRAGRPGAPPGFDLDLYRKRNVAENRPPRLPQADRQPPDSRFNDSKQPGFRPRSRQHLHAVGVLRGRLPLRAQHDSGRIRLQPELPAGDAGQLFTFTALSGQLGEFDTLPENWIIEWENFVDVGAPFDRARRIDTKLVEPLFTLPDLQGRPRRGDRARLAVRNLLRGYLLRLPTGQAVASALKEKLAGVRDIPVLAPEQIRNAAASQEQVQKLEAGGFLERTPLWYYILAEAAVREYG